MTRVIHMNTLKDLLPHEFFNGEYEDTAAMQLIDSEVATTHYPYQGGKIWPGSHKNVNVWWELSDGLAVGWNENVGRGWSFPVKSLRECQRTL